MPTSTKQSVLLLAGLSGVDFLLLWLPSFSAHYGFYSDELYYLACADRPALGYVDHPPLFVWLLGVHRAIFGDSLVALRALPAATGAATLFLAGWMARRLQGGRFAQGLAALAVMVSTVSLSLFSFFTVNCTGLLLWTLASWLLLELCRSGDRRLWLALGGVLGLGLLNKHTAVVPVVGVAVACLATGLRRDLRSPWPWLGAALAAAIVAPNVYWQWANDWPSLAFYAGVEGDRRPATIADQIGLQIVAQNPVSLPIWACGGYALACSPRFARYRALAWLFATAFVLALLGGSSLPYRIGGVYPLAFAAGSVFLEGLRKPDAGRWRRVWNTWTLPACMLLSGAAIATLALPILPPALLERHPLYDAEQGSGWREEVGINRIPYHLGNRTHWEPFVDEVMRVVDGLDPSERESAIVLADYFGHAGALEHYARGRVPPVYSPMTGYLLWGPPPDRPAVVIAIGIDEEYVRRRFERPTVAAIFRCTYCPPVVDALPIYVTGPPRRPFSELWPEIGAIDRLRAQRLRAQRRARAGGG